MKSLFSSQNRRSRNTRSFKVRKWIFVLNTLVILTQASWARAETESSSSPSSGPAAATRDGTVVKVTRDARGRKIQTIDFSDALIEGKVRTPEGFVIQSKQAGRFKSLIELPKNFRERIQLDAQDVGSALSGAAR